MNAQHQTAARDVMSSMLKSLGFDTLSADVLTADAATLPRYARITIKNSPAPIASEIRNNFALLGLI